VYVDRSFGSGRIRLLAFDATVALRSAIDHAHYEAIGTILSGRGAPMRDDEFAEFAASFQFSSHADIEGAVATVLRRDVFEPPPLPLILLALALYVLVVGPLDWIVLRRLGKQRLTTFTFGGAVLLFTAVAYGASFLVFASGAVVNRIVLVDLFDGGRAGRQLIRVHDIVGYYSPRGADRELHYPLPTVVSGATLPGGSSAAEVGSALPVLVSGTEALDPTTYVQVAFRSQRVVRSLSIGATGRTIETEWVGDSAHPDLRILNGLPVDLDAVRVILPRGDGGYVFERIAAGRSETATWTSNGHAFGDEWLENGSLSNRAGDTEIRGFLGFLSRTSTSGIDGATLRADRPQPLSLRRQILLARTGIGRGDALRHGRALLLASAGECPISLPATEDDGTAHILIRTEIDLP